MKTTIAYLRRSFILELKRTIAYPATFWAITLLAPLYSAVQIIFVEALYTQTSSFGGYSKYEAYLVFATYALTNAVGYFFFYNKLNQISSYIRGRGEQSFDSLLIKPIDTQIVATLGGFTFGNISSFTTALGIMVYALIQEPQPITLLSFFGYVAVVLLGSVLFYATLLFARTWLFWVPDFQVSEALWWSFKEYGQYPRAIYKGALGLIFNILVPITIMASIPTDILLGKLSLTGVLWYSVIVGCLVYVTRLFWHYSIRKYTSYSS